MLQNDSKIIILNKDTKFIEQIIPFKVRTSKKFKILLIFVHLYINLLSNTEYAKQRSVYILQI